MCLGTNHPTNSMILIRIKSNYARNDILENVFGAARKKKGMVVKDFNGSL